MSDANRIGGTDTFVFLHGFTQTHHHCHDLATRIALRLEPRPTSTFIDLPGHGLSRRVDPMASIDQIGATIIDTAGPGTYVGYSMGGRCALIAAATLDPRVERLILIGATPGIDDPVDRRERQRLDADRADRLELVGVDAFLDEWMALPMFARLPDDPTGLHHRRRNDITGLAHSLRHHGTGSQAPLWDRLATITIPVLVVAGADDEKFASVGEQMTARLPRSRFRAIAGAGHAAHLERPVETADAIVEWLAGDGLLA